MSILLLFQLDIDLSCDVISLSQDNDESTATIVLFFSTATMVFF